MRRHRRHRLRDIAGRDGVDDFYVFVDRARPVRSPAPVRQYDQRRACDQLVEEFGQHTVAGDRRELAVEFE